MCSRSDQKRGACGRPALGCIRHAVCAERTIRGAVLSRLKTTSASQVAWVSEQIATTCGYLGVTLALSPKINVRAAHIKKSVGMVRPLRRKTLP